MLPTKETAFYWYQEHVIPVDHEIELVNPSIEAYAKKSYGGISQFLETVVKQISLQKTGDLAFVHPTSGRALVHKIKPGYVDPNSGFPCFVVDVKGSGFTYPGYVQTKEETKGLRSEYMQLPHRALRGALTLNEATLDFYNTQIAQQLDILTPVPVAVVRPTTVYLENKKVSIADFRNRFDLPADFQLAFYIRAWPVTSTRLNDIFPFPHCDFPSYDDMFTLTETGELSTGHLKGAKIVTSQPYGDDERIELVKNARRVWKELEYPLLKHVLPQASTPDNYLAYFWGNVTKTLTTMLSHRLSPCTGQEFESGSRHMHLQNWTTLAALTEWSVITQTEEVSQDRQKMHIQKLIQSSYEAVLALSLLVAPQYEDLPDLEEFVCELPITDSLTQSAIADFLPNPIPKKPHQVVWIEKSLGSTQTFVDWLKFNQRAILA